MAKARSSRDSPEVKQLAQAIYDSWPDADFLGVQGPLDDETVRDYIKRAAAESGDTLFVFCLRELIQGTGDQLTADEIETRLDRAISDLESVKTALLGRLRREPCPPT